MESPSKEPSLRRQAPWVVGCRIVGILTTLAGNILAARLLGPAEFGLYLFISSVAAFGGLLGSAGLSDAALRFSSESLALGRQALAAAYLRKAALLGLLTTLVAATLVGVGLALFQATTGRFSEPILLVALTMITLVALAWQQLAGDALRGLNNLRLASLFSGGIAGGPVSTLLFVVGVVALLWAKASLSATGAVALLALSVCLTVPMSLLSVWRLVRRELLHVHEPSAALSSDQNRQMLGMMGTVLVLHVLTFIGLQLDIWIGEVMLEPEALGVYGVAKRSMLLAAMPVQMAMLTVVAAIPRLHAQGRRRDLQNLMRGAAFIAAVPALAAIAVLAAAPEPFLRLLFGGSYAGAAPLIRILAVGNLVMVLAGNPINVLTLTGRHRAVFPVNLTSTAVIALGGPLAAWQFGAAGLAWASAGALATQNLLLWGLARWQAGVWTHVGAPRWEFVTQMWPGQRALNAELDPCGASAPKAHATATDSTTPSSSAPRRSTADARTGISLGIAPASAVGGTPHPPTVTRPA